MANAEVFNDAFDAGAGIKDKSSKKGKKMGASAAASPGSYKKGGKVHKTGYAKVHKGEIVLTAAQAKGRGKSKKKKASRKRVARKA